MAWIIRRANRCVFRAALPWAPVGDGDALDLHGKFIEDERGDQVRLCRPIEVRHGRGHRRVRPVSAPSGAVRALPAVGPGCLRRRRARGYAPRAPTHPDPTRPGTRSCTGTTRPGRRCRHRRGPRGLDEDRAPALLHHASQTVRGRFMKPPRYGRPQGIPDGLAGHSVAADRSSRRSTRSGRPCRASTRWRGSSSRTGSAAPWALLPRRRGVGSPPSRRPSSRETAWDLRLTTVDGEAEGPAQPSHSVDAEPVIAVRQGQRRARSRSNGSPSGSSPTSGKTWAISRGPSLVSSIRPSRHSGVENRQAASPTRSPAWPWPPRWFSARREREVRRSGHLRRTWAEYPGKKCERAVASSVGPFAREDLGGRSGHEDRRPRRAIPAPGRRPAGGPGSCVRSGR